MSHYRFIQIYESSSASCFSSSSIQHIYIQCLNTSKWIYEKNEKYINPVLDGVDTLTRFCDSTPKPWALNVLFGNT